MNVQPLLSDRAAASQALRQYKQHRETYDKRDWEIERIYRAISKGKTVISVRDAVIGAGVDDRGRPRLAVMRADQQVCICERWQEDRVVLRSNTSSRAKGWYFEFPWPGRPALPIAIRHESAVARLPRIPPQFRPAQGTLPNYHILWEADWLDLPKDPMLLRRIGEDAWIVLAAWDLTPVELSVLRAHAR